MSDIKDEIFVCAKCGVSGTAAEVISHPCKGSVLMAHRMTLRDWYIGQALVGILAHQGLRGNPELQAQNACDLANLVMQAREEQAREEEP